MNSPDEDGGGYKGPRIETADDDRLAELDERISRIEAKAVNARRRGEGPWKDDGPLPDVPDERRFWDH